MLYLDDQGELAFYRFMGRTLRHFVAFAVMIVIACGNGLAFCVPGTSESAIAVSGVLAQLAVPHDHAEHDHSMHVDAANGEHASLPSVEGAGYCSGSDCLPIAPADEHSAQHPCNTCPTHCCITSAALPPTVLGETHPLFAAITDIDRDASLTPGSIFYPLLRPPRAAA